MNQETSGCELKETIMKRVQVVLTLIVILALANVLIADDQPPAISHDGLHLVPGTEVAAAWVKPNADFGVYDKVMILEAHVAFRKNWAQDHNRTSVNHVFDRDVERIKQAMKDLFRETFVEVLEEKGGYPVVAAPGAGVLLVRPAIIDLEVTAPDLDTPGSETYNASASAGAATLFLELFDSVSGEILARAIDRQAAIRPGPSIRWADRVTNRNEAKALLAGWARLLRERLDEIHGKGK